MAFEPGKHLRNIKGKGGNAEYLDVKWRLVWLREEHPDATTAAEHIDITPDIAIFKATVTIPGGGSASDYGSETPRDFGDYIEKASTKAMGRALAALGYGTQFVGEELNEGDRIVDSPRELPAPRPAPPSNGTPAPAARAVQPNIVFTHNPPAGSPLPHPLLAEIRNQDAPVKDREQALTDYYMGAHTIEELNKRQEAVKGSGISSRVVTATYNWHADRIDGTAAAPAAPPPSH